MGLGVWLVGLDRVGRDQEGLAPRESMRAECVRWGLPFARAGRVPLEVQADRRRGCTVRRSMRPHGTSVAVRYATWLVSTRRAGRGSLAAGRLRVRFRSREDETIT